MSFDALAPHYGWMERVLAGRRLQRCRTAFLPGVLVAKNILIVGEGRGGFLAECRRYLPDACITCVDASGKMLEAARRRLEKQGLRTERVQFIHADALEWSPPDRAFDLIVTHFFLDCFRRDQLEMLVTKFGHAAVARAGWLLADFAVPAAGPGRWRAQVIHRLMYVFFRVATRLPARELTPPDEFLRASQFTLRERRTSEWGLLHTDWWERGCTLKQEASP